MPEPGYRPTRTDYVAAILEWQAYADRIWTGDEAYSTSVNNHLANRAAAMLDDLRSQSDWQATLESMATSELPIVRLMAAHELYESDPERAVRIYSEIEQGPYGKVSKAAHWAAQGHRSRRPAGGSRLQTSDGVPRHPASFDPRREATAEAVLAVHGAVMNGGFVNAFVVAGHRISDAIGGYEDIGLEAVAQLLRDGVALFPDGHMPRDAGERQRLLDHLINVKAFVALDFQYDELVTTDEFLGDRLDAYLDRRQDS